jgi:4-alpha-glucanotransferase
MRLPAGTYEARIAWEDGSQSHLVLEAASDGEVAASNWLAPRPGYHRLRLIQGERSEDYIWILSPGQTWSDETRQRHCGVTCFLPSLRSERNWGCGDFRDLVDFARAFAGQHFDYIALNPLHALANRLPYNASPYSPLSLLRLNFIYLAIEEIPDYKASALAGTIVGDATFQAKLAALRSATHVDYEGVSKTKHFLLKILYRQYLRTPDPAFEQWRRTREPWVTQFGRYLVIWRYLHRRHPDTWIWQEWPSPYRNPRSEACEALAARLQKEVDFFAWVQWRLEQQLEDASREVRALGYSAGLYCDLAVACDKAGPDRWANPHLFAQGIRIGSPPDDFNVNGQDWGFPALRPLTHCPETLAYFRESLRASARAAGIIRLDHVMRLARLYSIPDGRPAKEGIYVRDHFRALLHIIAIESHRHRTMVVGEDLGTMPEYFRGALEEFGILSYRLVMFEWDGSDLRRAQDYPQKALCSFTTHDLASFDGFLSAQDLAVRKKVGFLSSAAFETALEERRRQIAAIARCFGGGAPASADEFFEKLARFLLRTPCRLVLIGLDELLAEAEQMNLPGTTSEHPNWRLKARLTLEAMPRDETLQKRLKAWRQAFLAGGETNL